MAETKVNIVEGKPFKITNPFKSEYKGGEVIDLTWDVDANIFPANTSKVRILLSTDFGKTFTHVLEASTSNDGAHTITLPNINVGTVQVGNFTPRAGVIKVEVIDGLAYALSQINPLKGGFTIKMNDTTPIQPPPKVKDIEFVDPPKDKIVSCSAIPEVEIPKITGGCSPKVEYQGQKEIRILGSCRYSYVLERTWVASDTCGNSKTHTQRITVEDKEAPQFVEKLPKNITIQEGQEIPKMLTLTATDNCSVNVVVTSSQEETKENGNRVIIYEWVATDDCGNTTTHTQKITVEKVVIDNKTSKNVKKWIYPNPVGQVFYLQGFENVSEVKIYDKIGRLIKTFKEQQEYDVSGLDFGNYFVLVKSKDGLDIFKMVKK